MSSVDLAAVSAAAAAFRASASCSSAVRLSATFWKAVSTVDAILRRGLLVIGPRRLLGVIERAAIEQCGGQGRAGVPEIGAVGEKLVEDQRRAAGLGGQA